MQALNTRISLHKSNIKLPENKKLNVSKHLYECSNSAFKTIPMYPTDDYTYLQIKGKKLHSKSRLHWIELKLYTHTRTQVNKHSYTQTHKHANTHTRTQIRIHVNTHIYTQKEKSKKQSSVEFYHALTITEHSPAQRQLTNKLYVISTIHAQR